MLQGIQHNSEGLHL